MPTDNRSPLADEATRKAFDFICGKRMAGCLIRSANAICVYAAHHRNGLLSMHEEREAEAYQRGFAKGWKVGQWQGWESSAALVEDELAHSHPSHSKETFGHICENHIRCDQNVVPLECRTIDLESGARLDGRVITADVGPQIEPKSSQEPS